MSSDAVVPFPDTSAARILVVDDERALHEDYARCLALPSSDSSALQAARDDLFGAAAAAPIISTPVFELTHATSGLEALQHVQRVVDGDQRFMVAFVDMRMPPGWNGIETIRRIWAVDGEMQVVLCTAYSDFTWDKVIAGIGRSDGLHLLRKPFSAAPVRRFAEVLSKKWQLAHPVRPRWGEP